MNVMSKLPLGFFSALRLFVCVSYVLQCASYVTVVSHIATPVEASVMAVKSTLFLSYCNVLLLIILIKKV